jgi:hypothetical protein
MHSNVSYFNKPEACSQAKGPQFLSDQVNGPILSGANILRNVISSAAKAKVGALFLNARVLATILCTALK